MSDRTVVAIGSSMDRDYSFLLPLTALFWRDRIGFHPNLMLVGDVAEWHNTHQLRTVYRALNELGLYPKFLGHLKGYPDHTLAQNCRQHVTCDPTIFPDTWVMPADADLWPLSRDYYQRHQGTDYKAVLYYSNGDHFKGKNDVLERAQRGLRSQTIPTCHATMRAGDWRTAYGLAADGQIPNIDILPAIQETLDLWMAKRAPGGDANFDLWMSDQQMMTEVLCAQTWFPSRVLFIERHGHPPVDRLDRSHRPWPPFEPKWTDAHLPKAPEEDAQWNDLVQIIDALLPQHSKWARDYRERYVSA